MANEIQIFSGLFHSATGLPEVSLGDPETAISVSQTNTVRTLDVQTIGTGTPEQLDFGDLTALGWWALKNTDNTHFVTIYVRSGGTNYAFGKVSAGKTFGPIEASSSMLAAMYAMADTAPVKLAKFACDA